MKRGKQRGKREAWGKKREAEGKRGKRREYDGKWISVIYITVK